MKKIIALVMSLFLMTVAFTGCSKKTGNSSNKKFSVVCTIFPQYDWVKQIIGDKSDDIDLTLLLKNGSDLHNYQPTTDDIVKLSSADMLIYIGGNSDKWVDDALKEAVNKDMIVINMMEVLGDSAKEEEVVEGMQAEEEEESEEEGPEYDEHIWLSVKNAMKLTSYISDKLCEMDSSNEEDFKKNTEEYKAKLQQLDSDYAAAVEGSAKKAVIFGDRFPFRYLVDDYNLKYYAAFVGCSAETEASFKTVVFLASKVDELGLNTVLTIDKSDQKIAKTIVDNTANKNQQILTMNSLQTVDSGAVEKGENYYDIMKENLEVLKKALS